ncbi:MAG: hypothetical protein MPN21_15090 [Thermoanaerobaculia bacterium]|nr:hypothetical protein [Thermoanaerobaculia bacterium]
MSPTLRPSTRRLFLAALAIVLLPMAAAAVECTVSQTGGLSGLPNPVLFVTQYPVPVDFATIGSTFANHMSSMQQVGRGGDLWILYTDGSLCNITREAGFGIAGSSHTTASALAVRDPHVHWDGTKALVSMVLGAPTQQYEWLDFYWQIYEVTGLGQSEVVSITRISGQPDNFNNVSPIYGSDGRILFTSDRPRDGHSHLYPQLDEYESTPTITGLWALDVNTQELELLDHAPSGVFTPIVDSFGRVLFTRWDHLQRDQQADEGQPEAFDWPNEEPGANTSAAADVFPEPRTNAPAPLNDHRFNHFFPWMINADGTEHETLNHVGRHEFHHYFNRNRSDDSNLEEFILSIATETANDDPILNFFQMKEDPTTAGRYFAVEAPEFNTHASGGIFRIDAPPSLAADQIAVTYLNHPDTHDYVEDGDPIPPGHSGHYRDPLPLSDGALLAAHTFETHEVENLGTRANPDANYDFRLKRIVQNGQYFESGAALTGPGGISRTVQFWDPDVQVTYSGPFWELSPVEVRSRPQPPLLTEPALPGPESQIFTEENIDENAFRDYLEENDLALIVSRDVTTRDAADLQQPYNLRVPGGAQTVGAGGTVYDVRYLQLFQGDQIRGYTSRDGRRVLATPMHGIDNPPSNGAPGSVTLGQDGSLAAFVPAQRALSWQLTSPTNEPVVRERYWLTFQPGEIRVCASCHGLNSEDQIGAGVPTNPPEALRTLLQFWLAETTGIFEDGFESGTLDAWSASIGD